MRFEDQAFLVRFLPVVLVAYFLTVAAVPVRRRATSRASVVPHFILLLASAAFLWSLATTRGAPMLMAAAVIVCLAVSYFVDRRRGDAPNADALTGTLYLVQFPLLLGGPLIRFRDFQTQIRRRLLTLGAFTYGIRRFVIGFIKVALIAAPLARPVDRIFALPAARLTTDLAWLGALCVSLQIYFQFSGYADMAIGLGRMIGLRYPENFRRPYTADSVREFWRRWNITLVTWLRDYLSLPIAGRDAPTARLSINIIAGFCFIGLWHRPGWMALAWGTYAGLWLALEALGLGAHIARLPRVVRHAYVLLGVAIGWVLLRSTTPAHAWTFLQAMSGWPGFSSPLELRFMPYQTMLALAAGVLFAGPLIPWISRWRVSVDAAAVSVLLMGAATGVFLWRGATQLLGTFKPARHS